MLGKKYRMPVMADTAAAHGTSPPGRRFAFLQGKVFHWAKLDAGSTAYTQVPVYFQIDIRKAGMLYRYAHVLYIKPGVVFRKFRLQIGVKIMGI